MPIYLDYNATTPIDPEVVDSMRPFLERDFGNPSSLHSYGRTANDAVAVARQQVAELINAEADEIIFTSGGTEASNHAIKGTVFGRTMREFSRVHLITTAIEHPATLKPLAFLERLGCRVSIVGVDRFGRVASETIAKELSEQTAFVSVMHANNEVGTMQPIRAIADAAHSRGALTHTDAAQSLGKVPVDVRALDIDLLSIAGHKVYAPKGVGALYVRRGVALEPMLHGAGHEAGRRAGTENVPYIVGLGKACEVARRKLAESTTRLQGLRDRLWQMLSDALGARVLLNGHPVERLPNTLNLNFVGHSGSELLARVPEIAASTGSACHEGAVTLSPVLAAMKVPPEIGQGAVRFSVGRNTTDDEIERAAALLIRAARREAL